MQISGFTWDPTKAFAEMNAVLSYLPSIPPCFLLHLKACTGDPDPGLLQLLCTTLTTHRAQSWGRFAILLEKTQKA